MREDDVGRIVLRVELHEHRRGKLAQIPLLLELASPEQRRPGHWIRMKWHSRDEISRLAQPSNAGQEIHDANIVLHRRADRVIPGRGDEEIPARIHQPGVAERTKNDPEGDLVGVEAVESHGGERRHSLLDMPVCGIRCDHRVPADIVLVDHSREDLHRGGQAPNLAEEIDLRGVQADVAAMVSKAVQLREKEASHLGRGFGDGARVESAHECRPVWEDALEIHRPEDLQRLLSMPVLGIRCDHRVPGDVVVLRDSIKQMLCLIELPGLRDLGEERCPGDHITLGHSREEISRESKISILGSCGDHRVPGDQFPALHRLEDGCRELQPPVPAIGREESAANLGISDQPSFQDDRVDRSRVAEVIAGLENADERHAIGHDPAEAHRPEELDRLRVMPSDGMSGDEGCPGDDIRHWHLLEDFLGSIERSGVRMRRDRGVHGDRAVLREFLEYDLRSGQMPVPGICRDKHVPGEDIALLDAFECRPRVCDAAAVSIHEDEEIGEEGIDTIEGFLEFLVEAFALAQRFRARVMLDQGCAVRDPERGRG
ncbi:uncharacterized protein LOC112348426 [Selaginella moellendorffii]|uniref:uncharacterized protein LOC112348426 n=1 Tax=Selaginella moellendorffii TaxID=88036 RepID=UPI000D1C48DE|nr:uncharacterized protein LOC112348426 [Selaginella moellendorffii]|eukprot:XP_024536645.1 uncharacterized protein LOC112348426 [Selaginella moellendorffii]